MRHPIFLALAAMLAIRLAVAQPATPPEDPRALVGQKVLALASHPAVTLMLRQTTGGRQAALARAMRLPGPALRLTQEGRVIYGWACDPAAGCEQDGVFLAHDAVGQRLFLVLVEGGAPNAWVPPRNAPWPAELAAPLRAFAPGIAARMQFEAETGGGG